MKNTGIVNNNIVNKILKFDKEKAILATRIPPPPPPPISISLSISIPVKVDIKPIVQHVISPCDGYLSEIVADIIKMPDYYIKDLLKFGAIYTCPVIPKSSLLDFNEKKLREILRNKHGKNPNNENPKRMTSDKKITMGSYIRIHLYPKRFPIFYDIKWENRIIYNCNNFIVINKPSGCQVPPRVDNYLECLTTWIKNLNIISDCDEELKTTHRLDTGTEGIVVLAKNKEFARYFCDLLSRKNKAINDNFLIKYYTCLTMTSVPIGKLIHYVKTNQRKQGEPAHTKICNKDDIGALYADLEVLSSNKIKLNDKAKNIFNLNEAYESFIKLNTGRTHQIRVQLASIGNIMLGDNLYHKIHSITNNTNNTNNTNTNLVYNDSVCDIIGLHATKLEIYDKNILYYINDSIDNDIPFILEINDIWWRL